jgi:hypothetical protein
LISFQYSAWLILGCIAIAAVLSWLLYQKNENYNHPLFFLKKRKYLLQGLRFASLFLILFLLLSPFINSKLTITEKPIILFLNDNSASIKIKKNNADSSIFTNNLNRLKADLADDYNIKEFTFGANLKLGNKIDYHENATNISDALIELYNQYNNQNVGAIILSSDGIYNQGSNPLYVNEDWLVPNYTIALGDTTFQKDFFIGKSYYNKICYLHDQTSIKVDVGSSFLSGQKVDVVVNKMEAAQTKQVYTHSFIMNDNKFSSSFEFIIDADKTGIQHYKIVATKLNGEATYVNNEQDIYIEVLDSRLKIEIIANAPHPDLAALQAIIQTNNNYDCKIDFTDNATVINNISDANLVVFHQVPAIQNSALNVVKAATEKHIPTLFIIGTNSNLSSFNQLQSLLQINGNATNTNEAQGILNSNFNAFTLNDNTVKALQNFPPLFTPFADYKLGGNAYVLAYQKIGSAVTKYPLIAYHEINGEKTGVIAGEGIWRWRLYDYLLHQNNDAVNEIIQKTIQYLVVKNDKRNFKASSSKSIFTENETINFEAFLYNQNFEFVNIPDVALQIMDAKKQSYNYTFSKSEKAYTLNVGSLPVGNYSFKSTTNFNGKELISEGFFSVSPLQLEGIQTVANHKLLYGLSAKTGGKMVYPNQIESIINDIKKSETIKPIIFTKSKISPLLDFKWLFVLLLTLLVLEWFLRKYWGSY